MFIPSLYAWFNIAALWDPYSNTGDIKIAIYSDDVTAEVLDQKVNIGDQILENLKDNDTLGWQFVKSKDELDKGVKSGKYYAGIYLPKNFSENLVSFVNGDIKHPEIDYSVNQKINAIAPKISDKGAGTIKDTISKEFVETVSKTLMEVLNEVGFNLDSNLPSIKKMTSRVLEIDDNLDEIDGYTKEVVELNKKMPELKGKLNQANDFVGMIPEVNQMTGKVLTLNQKMPEIEKYGDIVYQVQGKIPEIENAGRQINQIDQDFDQVVKMMDEAINEANKGLGIISDAQQVLPEVSSLAKTANEMIPEVKKDIGKVQKSLPYIAGGVNSGIKIVKAVSGETIVITDGLIGVIGDTELSSEEQAQLAKDLQSLSDRLANQSQMIQNIIELLQDLQNLTGSNNLNGVIGQLQSAKNAVDTTKARVDYVYSNLGELAKAPARLKQLLSEIGSEAKNINSIVSNINTGEIEASVNKLLEEAQTMLTQAGNITNTIINDDLINRIDSLMTSTSKTINQAVGFLESYKKELPAIQQEIHSPE